MMMPPKITCNPPNATAINQLIVLAGPNSATQPAHIKQIPITGRTFAEKAPPVTTPAPYINSHVPGIVPNVPTRSRTRVIIAPAVAGGTNPSKSLRTGEDSRFISTPRAFRCIANPEIAADITESTIQILYHVRPLI